MILLKPPKVFRSSDRAGWWCTRFSSLRDELANPLEDAVAELEKGQTTDMLTLPYGFVILKVDDKHNGGILSLSSRRRTFTDPTSNSWCSPKSAST